MLLILMSSKVGFRKISSKRVSVEPVDEQDWCQIGLTAIIMEMSTPCANSSALTADDCSLRAH